MAETKFQDGGHAGHLIFLKWHQFQKQPSLGDTPPGKWQKSIGRRYKKGHMTNIHFTDKEAIVDFVKDHEELYDKINKHFKDKARKKCLWEQFANHPNLSVKVCKTWFDSQRTCYGKLMQLKVVQASKEIIEHQNSIQGKFWIPEVTHQTQQIVRLQVPGPWSKCFSCYSTR